MPNWERLTKRMNGRLTLIKTFPSIEDTLDILVSRLETYEDTGLSPERCAELAKAEQEGRLLISPVPPGGKTYYAVRENCVGNYEILTGSETVTGLALKDDSWYVIDEDIDLCKIGSQYAALSVEEAKKALLAEEALESEGG